MDYIFKRPTDEYKLTLKPINNYLDQASEYLSIKHSVDKKEAISVVKRLMKKNKVSDPEITYRQRADNGDRSFKTNTLNKYINEVIENGEILTPTFTVNEHPSKKRSLHADYLANNIELRKQDKHQAFKYKQQGDADKFLYYNTLQKVRKIFNNSLSGAYASRSTTLSFPSNHSILTSITRSVASIGNSVSESIIAGNKYFKTPDMTINYITSVVTAVNMKSVAYVMQKYSLHIPTVEETMSSIIKSSVNYWTDSKAVDYIREFINKLDDNQRAAVVYTNDLHHLKVHNEEFVKVMLTNIARRCTEGSVKELDDINNTVEGVMNLVHHICMDDIQGKTVNYKDMVGTDTLKTLASTARNVTIELNKYQRLFRVFLTSDILPINIAEVKDMIRETIVLSDTDSTCGAYDEWVEWYFGHTRYSAEAVALSAVVMTINTQAIDHNIKVFAKNMNIESSLVEMLKMKNEFFWSSFTVANVSKHYYADTRIQEGNVFPTPELELKGVHLISSAGNQMVTKEAHDMMNHINDTVIAGGELDPKYYINKVIATENKLIDLVTSGDTSIFKTEKIKSPSSYKLDDSSKTPYFYHMLWNAVFKEQYGDPGEPEYMVLKVPTILAKDTKLREYLAELEDGSYKTNLSKILAENNKTSLGIIRVPMAIAKGKGIPKEILEIVDVKRMIMDSLNVMYLTLETIGIFNKKGMLISESNII